jgi:hypothetical protein
MPRIGGADLDYVVPYLRAQLLQLIHAEALDVGGGIDGI